MLGKNTKLLLRILYFILFKFLMLVLVSLFKDFKDSVTYLKKSSKLFVALILVFSFSNFILAASSYIFLSFKKLKVLRSVLVQFAANTMNRILPGGIGAIGTLYDYLIKSGNSKPQGLALVSLNNLLGLIAGVLNLVLLLLFGNLSVLSKLNFKLSSYLIVGLGLGLFIGAVYLIYRFNKKARKFIIESFVQLKSFKDHKSRLVLSFAVQLLLNVSNVLCLYFAIRALHLDLNIAEVGLSYNLAILFGNIIPAPGGVGSVDAGLVGILIIFGKTLPQAVAVSILFRVLNMWVPFILGLPAIFIAKKKKYI